MTVGELIKVLSCFDPDMTVTVTGYEGGVSEKWVRPKVVKVIPNANEGIWYYGEHEEDDNGTVEMVVVG